MKISLLAYIFRKLSHHCLLFKHPVTIRSDIFSLQLTCAAASKQVFLSQVYRRARLLNRPFQRAVFDTIHFKATRVLSETNLSKGAEPQLPLVPGPRSARSACLSLQSSEWADSSAPSVLQKHQADTPLNSSEMGVCTVHWPSAQSVVANCNVSNSEMKPSLAEWWAEVHPAPIKTTARMKEKLAK